MKNKKNVILPNYDAKKLKSFGGLFSWGAFSIGLAEEANAVASTDEITVCILTYQSILTIRNCIKTARHFANKIIVVDSESTDGTYQVALELADKVIKVKNDRGFDYKRNIAIKNAETNWIFMLDSDEVLPKEVNRYLRKAITWADEMDVDVFWLSRFWLKYNMSGPLRYYNGHHFLWPDPQARLFRKSVEPYYVGNLHEHIVTGKGRTECLIACPECTLVHLKFFIMSEEERIILLNNRRNVIEDGPDKIQLLPEKSGFITTEELQVSLDSDTIDLLYNLRSKGEQNG